MGDALVRLSEKLAKLEKFGLIQRSYKHKQTVTTKSYNQLIIYVWKQTPYFYNKYGVAQSEVPTLRPQTNHKYITEKYNIDYNSQTKEIKSIANDWGIHKEVDTKELIEPFNKLKDRSNKSSVIKNAFNAFVTEKNSDLSLKQKGKEDNENQLKKVNKKYKKDKKYIKNPENIDIKQYSTEFKNKYENQDITTLKDIRIVNEPNTNGFLGLGKYLHEVLDYLTDEIC